MCMSVLVPVSHCVHYSSSAQFGHRSCEITKITPDCFRGLLLTPMPAAAAKLLQSCRTLCDPMDGSPPGGIPRPWDSPGKSIGVGCHFLLQCRKVKSENEVAWSCPTLCNPMDCSTTGSSAHGILQARVLEGLAFPFSRRSSQLCDKTQVSHIADGFFTSWATREAQEHWTG